MFRKANLKKFKAKYNELLNNVDVKNLISAQRQFEKAETEEEIRASQQQLNEAAKKLQKYNLEGVVAFAEAAKKEYDKLVKQGIKNRGKKSNSGNASPIITKRTSPSISRKQSASNSASNSSSNSTSTSPITSRKNSLSDAFDSSEISTSLSDSNDSSLEGSWIPESPRMGNSSNSGRESSFGDLSDISLEHSPTSMRRASLGDLSDTTSVSVNKVLLKPLDETVEKKLIIYKAFHGKIALDHKLTDLYKSYPDVKAMNKFIGAVYWLKQLWQKDEAALVHEKMFKPMLAEGQLLLASLRSGEFSKQKITEVERYQNKLVKFIREEEVLEKSENEQSMRMRKLMEEDRLAGLRNLQADLQKYQRKINPRQVGISEATDKSKSTLSKSNSQRFTQSTPEVSISRARGFFKTASSRDVRVRKGATKSSSIERPKPKG